MAWHTPPYSLPEEDTGTYTYTRDPFAFCAVAIRAMTGQVLRNHEELYEAFENIDLPIRDREVMARAISRNPGDRYATVLEFSHALRSSDVEELEDGRLLIAVRLTAGLEKSSALKDLDENGRGPLELVLAELNEVTALSPSSDSSGELQLETSSLRLRAKPDPNSQDHLVIASAARKRFRLDVLLGTDSWVAPIDFVGQLPRQADRQAARSSLQSLYTRLEAHLSNRHQERRGGADDTFSEWSNLLESLRHIARNSIPALRYTSLEREGSRLIATIENPQDALEEQWRVININNGRWIFRGEIESIRGNQCILVSSSRSAFDLDRIPAIGLLENDWAQTKIALDRQARALDRFKADDTPSSKLRGLLTGKDQGPPEPAFGPVATFFDSTLDDEKKAVVSRFHGGADLLVIHGPPGTGKTKLIVELVRQELKANPDSKILLASQTHVALDNALERLLRADDELACVRIGSGTKEADARVAASSLEQRSSALREQMAISAHQFLEERASKLGIDRHEVDLGLAVIDLIGTKRELDRQQELLADVEAEASLLEIEIGSQPEANTRERSSKQIRARVLEEELERVRDEVVVSKASVQTAKQKLISLGKDGSELAELTAFELLEWSHLLLGEDDRKAFGELMKLSEDWRLRFGQSDDFKAAIITSSSVVAGTCVGFCREEASLRTTFDLCIVDESGKATTTELLVPLAQARRAVLLGDHHQLPAILDHSLKTPEIMERFDLNEQQLSEQLFEKLTKDLADGCRAALTEQHRMRGAIGRLVSHCFYEKRLTTSQEAKQRKALDLSIAGIDHEVTWLDPYGSSQVTHGEQRRGTSYENACEAQTIVALLKRLQFAIEHGHASSKAPSIGVISGYAPQVNLIRNEIRKERTLDNLYIECASVHAFQGREVDICIYSVTRRNDQHKIGMLSDWRHLNVALSRARNHLIIVGDIEFCRTVTGENPFSRLLNFIETSEGCAAKDWLYE